MLKVAITGNIASGKSAVEEIIKAKGFSVLDTDIIAHDLLEDNEIKALIIEAFAEFDIIENNQISRPKLGKIVFGNEVLRKKLESILHPQIKNEIERFFTINKNEKVAFVSIPLLFEANFQDLFDKIILIYANDDIRLERLIKRNNLSLEYAKNRLKIQISQDEKTSLADYVIYNDKTLKDLQFEVKKIISLL